MCRGRGLFLIAACALAVTCGFATAARADGGGPGSPMAICQDLQDGKVDGSYTQSEWQAFLSDPTVQGYCSAIVPPCVYPSGGDCSPPPTTTTTVTTTTPAPPPVTTTVAAAVPLTPTTTAAVKGAQHTVTAPPKRTATAPAKRSAVAPSTAVKRAGTLPFTGMQLSLLLVVGLGLVGAGLVLRATGKRRSDP